MFTWLALYHSQAWRYKLSHILFRDMISKISNPSAGLAITPRSIDGGHVEWEEEEGESVSLSGDTQPQLLHAFLGWSFTYRFSILHTHAQPTIQIYSCSAQETRMLEISRLSHNLCTESVPMAIELLALNQDNWSDFPLISW